MPRARSVRVRSAAAAMLVVALALAAASIAVLAVVRGSVLDSARATALGRAQDVIAELQADGQVTTGLNLDAGPGRATTVTLLDTGTVVAQTSKAGRSTDAVLDQPGRPLRWVAWSSPAHSNVSITLPVAGVQGVDTVRVVQDAHVGLETVSDVAQALAIAVPLLVLLVGATTFVLAGRALSPVEAIRARSAQISDADLDARIAVPPTGDEIERLARTLNEMLERLHESHQAQAQFVADASHELRTPLAAMRAELDVTARSGAQADWPAAASRLAKINMLMQTMVDDLLALARTNSAEVDRSLEVDLDDVVESIGYAAAKTCGMDVEVLTSPARVNGNAAELSRACQNLLDNATRWATSRVRLSLVAERDRVVLDVDDDGPGVPGARREQVFERFVRLDEARSRQAGGAGLGLAITRTIAAAHGGTITCLSSPLGGARFRLTLPTKPPGQPSRSTR